MQEIIDLMLELEMRVRNDDKSAQAAYKLWQVADRLRDMALAEWATRNQLQKN